ncbi:MULTISPECIES: DUF4184 family protein [unclassified Saccharothrix]|uniref:DUF4184 family protein n=1 Tax=unclassified Saccharothrix TaxID=2593673 RepID=UPI00307FB15E
MPFTFAHPAAVLPLRRHLWFPGLAAGSIAPDVAYYLPVPGGADGTHSVVGLVGIDLLLGFLLLALWHVFRTPLLALSSAGWRSRVTPPNLAIPTWRAAVTAVLSLVVGAATHIAWDTFTHTDGIAVRHWDLLRVSIVGPHRLYNVIGYVSSLGGLLLLAAVTLGWYRGTPPRAHRWPVLRGRSWVLVGIVAAAVVGAVVALADPVSRVSTYDWVRRLLVGTTQGAGLALTLYVLCWHLRLTPRLDVPDIGARGGEYPPSP